MHIPPHRSLQDIQNELERVVGSSGVEAKVELYLYRPGFEGQGAEPLVKAARKAYRLVFQEELPPIPSPYTCVCGMITTFTICLESLPQVGAFSTRERG